MFKTISFFLCSVAILVSGTENAVTNSAVTTTERSGNTSTSSTTASAITTTSTITPKTSSTEIPNNVTTSTPSPTPDPNPKPVPPPETGKWLVNGTNQTCIIVQMALQIRVSYMTRENKTAYQVLNLPGPNETLAQGTCGTAADLEQNITLTWNATNTTTVKNNLMLHFVKNITKNQYALHHLELSLAPQELPQILANDSVNFIHGSDQFTTGINNSYRCLKQQTLSLNTTVDDKPAGNITVSNLQFQAFHVEHSTTFGFAEDCAFDTPDIVPIAVGCALALLVVIVLVAYLAGRRCSQARGYVSM